MIERHLPVNRFIRSAAVRCHAREQIDCSTAIGNWLVGVSMARLRNRGEPALLRIGRRQGKTVVVQPTRIIGSNMFELYHGNTSVCSQKVRLVLEAKGVKWESRLMNLQNQEQFDPQYLRLNPNGVVPTLVHDATPIIESTLINEYLDDTVPELALKPTSALGKVKMRMWTKRLDEGLHSATSVLSFAAVLRHGRGKPGSQELKSYLAAIPNAKRRDVVLPPLLDGPLANNVPPALRLFEHALRDMEAALADGSWLAGDSYSLADAAMTPYVKRLDMLQLSNMWADRPRLAEWYARVRELANYAPAVEAYLSPEIEAKFLAGGTASHDAFMQALQSADRQ